MIHPSFDIGLEQENETFGNACLLMEVGERFFNYIIYDSESRKLLRVRQYIMEPSVDKGPYERLEEIVAGDPLLARDMKETGILYNFAESNLLPEEHFSIGLNTPLTQLIYGDVNKGLALSEKINGWEMYNIYRVPKYIHTLFQQRFQAGKYWHFYTLFMSTVQKEKLEGKMIKAVFYNDRFVAAFFSGDRLLIIQTFLYQTPEDASYHLLLMCRQFDIAAADTSLQISGLIDEQSALYTELTKYFPVVEYEGIPETIPHQGILDEHPAYYFSPLLKISLCV